MMSQQELVTIIFILEIVAKLFYVRAIEMTCGSQRSGFHGQRRMPSLISLTNVRVYICFSSYTYPKKVKIISVNKNYLERPLTGCNCCMQKSQRKSGPGGGVLPYMGYIGMCRCEEYNGFQAVYSRFYYPWIVYINQSVWIQNRVSFFRKLISWLKNLSRLWIVV